MANRYVAPNLTGESTSFSEESAVFNGHLDNFVEDFQYRCTLQNGCQKSEFVISKPRHFATKNALLKVGWPNAKPLHPP